MESLQEILTKRRSKTFYKPIDVHKCYRREYFFNMHLEYCESVWYDFSCVSVVNNLSEKQIFSDQMNRNRPDLILARCHWSCSTIENLLCVNSAVNEII